MPGLQAKERKTDLEEMAQTPLDVLVIGGGITGAGIAWDASLRGMRVGLVEMQDFAEGTSSRSTKLVHGGLRYLQQYQLGVVRETGRERAVLYRLAPHVVRPTQMLLPLVPGGNYSRLTMSFGTWLYDRLAGVKKTERRKMLSAQETFQLEPLLTDWVNGGGLYYEYLTNDARLTVDVIKSAVSHGAFAVNHAKAEGLLYGGDGRIRGATIRDRVDGKAYEVQAKVVVNAAGPWVDQLRKMDHSMDEKHLLLAKGVHIVVPYDRLPLGRAVYFDNVDKRMIFAIPRGKITYIGTTDTEYEGDPAEVIPEREDVQYLLDAASYIFPSTHLTLADLCSSWAGVRPLIAEDGKQADEVSRKDEIWVSKSGLITIAGGKLTAFRKMAERAVDRIAVQLHALDGRSIVSARTIQVPISGGECGGSEGFAQQRSKWVQQARERGLSEEDGVYLADQYGSNTLRLLDYWQNDGLAMAQLRYAEEEERAVYPLDFLVRRSSYLFFEPQRYAESAARVVDQMAQYFHWNEQLREEQANQVQRTYAIATLKTYAA
ncbi:MAG: FAD-dependent oxidoreductase [Firmicutes bacterium]|nr:FAD-dependent oxidoreductase [Bacillota bacterium]